MIMITLPSIYVDKCCHIVADPCALIMDLILGNSGFGDLVKLLNLRWSLNIIVIFLYFS